MLSKTEVQADIWGDFAMFTPPENKVERVSYEVPTPSACRNILSAIYGKPNEFYYQVKSIEIMNPIRTISIEKNETKEKVNSSQPDIIVQIAAKGDKGLVQRNNIYLKDVYYRITADICMFDGLEERVNIKSLRAQFYQRVNAGKCFYQPYLGTRECMCFFSSPNPLKKPDSELNRDFGIMLYDVFDFREFTPLNTDKKHPSGRIDVTFYDAKAVSGKITVPAIDSDEIYRRQARC